MRTRRQAAPGRRQSAIIGRRRNTTPSASAAKAMRRHEDDRRRARRPRRPAARCRPCRGTRRGRCRSRAGRGAAGLRRRPPPRGAAGSQRLPPLPAPPAAAPPSPRPNTTTSSPATRISAPPAIVHARDALPEEDEARRSAPRPASMQAEDRAVLHADPRHALDPQRVRERRGDEAHDDGRDQVASGERLTRVRRTATGPAAG